MSEYYLFNKPKGIVTARTDSTHKTVMDYFPSDNRNMLHPVGRLDIDTTGLLIITDNGLVDRSLITPESHVEKEYILWVFGSVSNEQKAQLESGVELSKGVFSRTAKVKILCSSTVKEVYDLLPQKRREHYLNNPDGKVTKLSFTISEGKRHEVKLMAKAVGCKVFSLDRIRIGEILLDKGLKQGDYRILNSTEIKYIEEKIILYKKAHTG